MARRKPSGMAQATQLVRWMSAKRVDDSSLFEKNRRIHHPAWTSGYSEGLPSHRAWLDGQLASKVSGELLACNSAGLPFSSALHQSAVMAPQYVKSSSRKTYVFDGDVNWLSRSWSDAIMRPGFSCAMDDLDFLLFLPPLHQNIPMDIKPK